MQPEDDSEQVGVATALDRTRALEALLRHAIYDTHAVSGDPSLDADSSELERESLLAVNEQLGLLGLKLRQYRQLGPHEYSKKTTVLSELDELRRDLITVSYTSQHAVVVAKGTLRDVRKFAEMRSEDDGLSDQDSDDYLSDESSTIDDGKQQGAAVSVATGTEEGNAHHATAAALQQTLKTGGSTASEQQRELEEALSRAEAALAHTKTRKGDERPPTMITQHEAGDRTVQEAVIEQKVDSDRQPKTNEEDDALLQKSRSLQLTDKNSKANSTQHQGQPLEQQQLGSRPENVEKQKALLQPTKQQEDDKSKELLSASSRDDMLDSTSSSTTKFADSPAPSAAHAALSKESNSKDSSSPFKGLGDKLQSSAADTILSGSAGSAASQRLAAWRPHSVEASTSDHAAGSIADSSSGSSISHEGDSASSVTSSDNLRILRLNSHTSTGVAAQSSTASTVHKSDKMDALAAPVTVGASESLRGKYAKADDSSKQSSAEPSHSVISKQLATQRGRFKPQTLPGNSVAEDTCYGGFVTTNGFSSDKIASASLAAPERTHTNQDQGTHERVVPTAEPQTRHYEPRRSSKPAARGREAQENCSGEKPRSTKRLKRRLVMVLAAAVVAGAAALLSPALSSPAREEWKREICMRLGRMKTPKQLAFGSRGCNKGRVSVAAPAAAAAKISVRSPLLDRYPDGNLGRG